MIYICIPTTPERRGRLKELLASIEKHTENVPHCVVTYENDRGGWVPAVYDMLDGIDGYVVLLGSDVVVEKDWLLNLSVAYFRAFPNDDGVAEPFNELHGPTLCQHPFAHSRTIKKYLDPRFVHFFSDNWFTDQARRDGKLIYVPEAKIEHKHFVNKKAPFDKTYETIFNKEVNQKDCELYQKLKLTL